MSKGAKPAKKPYKKKPRNSPNPNGAPTICTDAVVAKANEYFDIYKDQELVPTIAGLSLHCGVSRQTIREWGYIDRRGFAAIVERCSGMQEMQLLRNGLSGEYNSAIAKLMLTKHGYTDQSKMGLTGGDGGPVKTENKWIVEGVSPNATPSNT